MDSIAPEGSLPSETPSRSTSSDLTSSIETTAAAIRAADYRFGQAGLGRLAIADPIRSAGYRELHDVLEDLEDRRARAALARLHFLLGQEVDERLIDATAEAIAERLDAKNDTNGAALAWTLHGEGETKLRALTIDGTWLSDEGPRELERSVFDLADESEDPVWLARSAWLASRQYPREHDDETIAAMADAAHSALPDHPRASALRVRTLLNLEQESRAESAMRDAMTRGSKSETDLLEFLDAAAVDADLAMLVDEAYAIARSQSAEPQRLQSSIDQRRTRLAEAMAQDADSPGRGFEGTFVARDPSQKEDNMRALADMVLGEPPRRHDAQWQATKQRGDAAFRQWLSRIGFVVFALFMLWLFSR